MIFSFPIVSQFNMIGHQQKLHSKYQLHVLFKIDLIQQIGTQIVEWSKNHVIIQKKEDGFSFLFHLNGVI